MRLAVLFLLAALAGCAAGPDLEAAEDAPTSALVLVSIDGFRHDYLDRADVDAPTLRWIAEGGVRAERLVPAYPTKTFPNHYTLVTGLHPESHGIVGNTMRDPERLEDGEPARFSLSNTAAVEDGRWWGGEPIWSTAERQGARAGTVFWPGSAAEIGGVRPSRWLAYDGGLPDAARVDTVLAWLDLPADRRPALLTLYFEAVDTAGHRYGPDAPETAAAIEQVDAALARLVDGLRQRGRLDATDLVVVSDHGMVALDPARRVILDDVVDLGAVEDVIWGEAAGIWPGTADADSLTSVIDALPYVRAYRREATPARLRHRDHPRIPPVVVIPEAGGTITSRAYVERYPDRTGGGAHGYDNAVEAMHGVFLARGPHFRTGTTGPLSAVDVYGVLAAVLGVAPAPNDGDPDVLPRVLR